MILIVGLGNIGKEYENTRHNTGFSVLDYFATHNGFEFSKNKFKGQVASKMINGENVLLLKPSTFMNLSGESVAEAVKFNKIELSKILIILDDIDLNLGTLRIRKSGSAGTHNGLKNIVNLLGSQDFPRLRIGIGKPENDLVDYVLSKFNSDELKIMEQAKIKANEVILNFISNGQNVEKIIINNDK